MYSMNTFAWETIKGNHQSALDTCKSLVKEGRLLPAQRILTLLESNLNYLATLGNSG